MLPLFWYSGKRKKTMPKAKEKLKFPENFLFGTATAGHQIEGNDIHSDWWDFEQQGKLPFKSGKACDSWDRWQEDIDLAKSLNNNSYRFSIEWSRIEPEEGKFNPEALKHYNDEIRYLHKQRMKAAVTLWHFALPKWFLSRGGFTKSDNIKFFIRYVQYLVDNLTDTPDLWLTVNEANTYTLCSYIIGLWPPKKKNLAQAIKVFINLTKAHNLAETVIHQKYPQNQVGYAHQMIVYKAISGFPHVKLASYLAEIITNRLFLWFTIKHANFIGLNYYAVYLVDHHYLLPIIRWKNSTANLWDGDCNDIGWFTHPEGIYDMLMSLKKYQLPVYITENGVADESDLKRQRFIANHFEWLLAAVKDGVDVRGYFYWTLVDNFEWAFGFAPKFGLFRLEENTLNRLIQPSANFYKDVALRRELDVG